MDIGCTTCPRRRGETRRASPMWRPPGAILSCRLTPGCGALWAPHQGLCMVRPSGPNLADLRTCFVWFGPKTTSGSGRKPRLVRAENHVWFGPKTTSGSGRKPRLVRAENHVWFGPKTTSGSGRKPPSFNIHVFALSALPRVQEVLKRSPASKASFSTVPESPHGPIHGTMPHVSVSPRPSARSRQVVMVPAVL
ncbi:hypothetical protein J3R75_002417 [Oligosphaera ethanolica]|uniref:Uncharacterized protein n=1 Tax=Oligosphaera ethanolica TaxID=760260 RepID=A0AAE3VH69_9BACT|nr:hypothetical protein [Oligosphaera ethanolica]